MRFLVDLNLSPQVAIQLVDRGHAAVHGSDLGLTAAPDEVVLAQARRDSRVLISADSDFGTILAATGASRHRCSTFGARTVDESANSST